MNDSRRRSVVMLLVILAVIVVGGIVAVIKNNSVNHTSSSAVINLEGKTVNYTKAVLDLYYANYGSYPVEFSDTKKLATSTGNTESFDSISTTLKGFDYKYSGDRKSYNVTYTSADGTKKSFAGNYEKDLH